MKTMNKVYIFIGIICVVSMLYAKLNIIDVHDAWQHYPSLDSSLSSLDYDIILNLNITNYVQKDISAIIKTKLKYLSNLTKTIIKSNDYNTHVEVGIIYAQNMFYKTALQHLVNSLKIKESSYAYNNIANVYYILLCDKLAIKNYNNALRISKNDPNILLNLAFIYYDAGKFDKAKRCYLKAVVIDPTLDMPEYRVMSGDDGCIESKASNKGVKKFSLKWIK